MNHFETVCIQDPIVLMWLGTQGIHSKGKDLDFDAENPFFMKYNNISQKKLTIQNYVSILQPRIYILISIESDKITQHYE